MFFFRSSYISVPADGRYRVAASPEHSSFHFINIPSWSSLFTSLPHRLRKLFYFHLILSISAYTHISPSPRTLPPFCPSPRLTQTYVMLPFLPHSLCYVPCSSPSGSRRKGTPPPPPIVRPAMYVIVPRCFLESLFTLPDLMVSWDLLSSSFEPKTGPCMDLGESSFSNPGLIFLIF